MICTLSFSMPVFCSQWFYSPPSLIYIYPAASPQAIDLFSKLLVFDPRKRLTAKHALVHTYLQELHDPEDEPVFGKVFDLGFEKKGHFGRGIPRPDME